MSERFSAQPGEAFSVEVSLVLCPDGTQRVVLLQLPDAFVLISADGARRLADLLTEAASGLELLLSLTP